MVGVGEVIKDHMKTYVQFPPRRCRADVRGPVELSKYERFQWMRDQLAREGFAISLPAGN